MDDLISLLGKLAPRYRKNAAWVMHPDTEIYVRKLKSSSTGEYYWQPSTAAGTPPTLLGIPCYVDVNMPVIASAASVIAGRLAEVLFDHRHRPDAVLARSVHGGRDR